MAKRKKIRILLADDHALMREGLRLLLEAEPDMQVVGEAADGQSAVRTAGEMKPDLVLMDVAMPVLNGIEATRRIAGGPGKPKIICLSMYEERKLVEAMLRAGASGYVLKSCGAGDLAGAIRTVCAGGAFLSPPLAGDMLQSFVRNDRGSSRSDSARLIPRERGVLQLISEGRTAKQIARDLGISQKTVLAHRHSVMEKLDLHSEAELTRYALRNGLTVL